MKLSKDQKKQINHIMAELLKDKVSFRSLLFPSHLNYETYFDRIISAVEEQNK